MLPWDSVLWGWFKSYISEIAAVRQFIDIIVKLVPANSRYPWRTEQRLRKLPDLSR
jgi:hypothetical protein